MGLEIKKPNVLVVEGKEDKRFFEALIEHLGYKNIQTMPLGGKDKLRENLKALKASRGFPTVVSLGVVRDADEDPAASFQSVRDALLAASLPAPKRPLEIAGKNPRVAVLILPREDSPGMLEDLCLEAVAENPAMSCVEQYFECLKQKGLSLPNNMSKAKIQAFLASQEKAGLRLGEAAEKGYWPWDHDAFQSVKDFIIMLFRCPFS